MNNSPVKWEKISTVLLDMDGTLLDLHFDNYFWHEHVPLRYSEKHEVNLHEAKQHLFQQYSEKRGTLNWYCTDYWSATLKLDIAHLKREIAHRITIFPHVALFLQRLKKLNKRVVLVTNAHDDTVEIKLDATKLREYFDVIVSSHRFGYAKEMSEFWPQFHQDISFHLEDTLLIDDYLAVLDAAQEFGLKHLVTVLQPDSSKPMQNPKGYYALKSFLDIMPE